MSDRKPGNLFGRIPLPSPVWGALIGAVVLVSGCGDDRDANVVGRLSWSFSYRDWTRATAEKSTDGDRSCTNQPKREWGPPYSPIATVQLTLADPMGQIPPLHRSYECAQGFAGRKIELAGMPRQHYELTLEGQSAAGTTLYRYHTDAYDAERLREHEFELLAVTGELSFSPAFANTEFSAACPSGVTSIRTRMFGIAQGVPANDATLTHAASTCGDGISDMIYLREIPVDPQPGAHGNLIATEYEMVVEALSDTGAVVQCGRERRSIRPGPTSIGGDPTLDSGACEL